MAITTIGKELLRAAVPADMYRDDLVFDKKNAKGFFQDMAEKHPEEYADTMHKLLQLSRMAGTEYGGDASISLDDLKLTPAAKQLQLKLRADVHGISQRDDLTPAQKNDAIVKYMTGMIPTVNKAMQEDAASRTGGLGLQMSKGFRGSPSQYMQLLFGDMLVADHRGHPIPVPGLHGYGSGVTPMEYWAGSYGSRKGYSDVQFATAKTGYFSKQVSLASQRIKITGEDCGAQDVGVRVDGDNPEIIGSVLARPLGKFDYNHEITRADLPALSGTKPIVRSLVTCQQEEGVCQKCAGRRDQGKYPPLGTYVGIISSRAIGEPLTQVLGLSAKHTGGVIGVNDQHVSGFEEIDRFLQVPENFPGAATLAPADGRVHNIRQAPQGGTYLNVGTTQVYVPSDRDLQVKEGQELEAGDALSSGTPNPAEIAHYKGLGGARNYFIKEFGNILDKNDVPSHRRNVETLARAVLDRVRITQAEGLQGHRIGDVVSYSNLQKAWQPRPGTEERMLSRSKGMYLEAPVLHYTIGTRMTPSVLKDLADTGVERVNVHADPPPFEPVVSQLRQLTGTDPDWKTRMSGFDLKRTFLDAARSGSFSPNQSTSPIPGLMNPTTMLT